MTKQLSVSAHSQPAAQCAGADPAPLRRRSAVAPYSQGCGVTPGSETGKQTIQWTALHSTDSSGPRPHKPLCGRWHKLHNAQRRAQASPGRGAAPGDGRRPGNTTAQVAQRTAAGSGVAEPEPAMLKVAQQPRFPSAACAAP